MKNFITFVILAFTTTLTGCLLAMFIDAALNGMVYTMNINHYGEGLIEVVLIAVVFLVGFIWTIKYLVDSFRRDK